MKKRTKKPAAVPYAPLEDEALKNPTTAAAFLNAVYHECSEDDFDAFFSALLKVVKAFGVSLVAEEMDKTRDAVYKAFRDHKNPGIKTFRKALHAMNLDFQIVERQTHL